MDSKEINEAIEHQKNMIRTLRKRLEQLELQKAQTGISTPPHINTEILELKEEIGSHEIELKRLQSLIDENQTSFKPQADGETSPPLTDSTLSKSQAEQFFYTLDDKPADKFPNMVKDAVRVQILGRTAVNLLGQYQKVFEQLGRGGGEICLLFVDPLSEASKFLYGGNPEIYRNNIISASHQVKTLKFILERRLQVRVTKHAPTLSMIIIEKRDPQQNFIQVQLYFLHSAVGRDRPIFRVNYGDKWYEIFQDEFSRLWSESIDWDVSKFLDAHTTKG